MYNYNLESKECIFPYLLLLHYQHIKNKKHRIWHIPYLDLHSLYILHHMIAYKYLKKKESEEMENQHQTSKIYSISYL